MAQSVSTATGVRESAGESIRVTLLAALRARRLLLVLDNCEHLVMACAELADAILRVCPSVRILATSREALGIAGAIGPDTWLPALPDGSSIGPLPGTSHGRYVDLNQKFADAWRVTDANSLFDYGSGTSTSTFTLPTPL